MSSEGLPVKNVVGTDVDLSARSVQGAANAASSSQAADSAATSADAAFKFSRNAKDAALQSQDYTGQAAAAAEAAVSASTTAYEDSKQAIDEAIRQSGFAPLDSFEQGANLTLVSQALRWEANNAFYSWRGLYPKQVPFGSTPETTGGFSENAWVDVSDLTFRTQVGAQDGGKYVGEVSSIEALRALVNVPNMARIFLKGYWEAHPGQGSGEFIAHLDDVTSPDNGGTIIVSLIGTRFYRKLDGQSVTPEMFGAVRGQAASDFIQRALDTGYDVNGMWGRYICDKNIHMPNYRSLISCEFDLLDQAYNNGAISSGDFCTINVIVNGTSPTTLYPSSQIAWRSVQGAVNSNVNIRANGVNTAAFFDRTSRHTFSIQANNITGKLNTSEGYGALLASGCVGNKGTVEGADIARHGLYISSGSSGNKVGVNLSRCLYKAAVNINSRPNQIIAENNEISGYIENSYTGVNFFVESAGGPNTGGAISNNRLVNLTIVGAAGISQNAILFEATTECETAFGNGWRNVLVTGAFESTTMPVVSIVNMPSLDTDGLKIRGTMNYRALSIGKANSASMGTMRLLNVDILTDSPVTGVYNNVDTGLLDFTGVSVVTGGSPYQFSGSTINNVVGGGKEELQTVSSSVPANSSVVVPVVFRREYYSARAICSISSASFSSENANVNYFAMTSSGCSVRLINTSTNAQTLSATIRISGL